MEIFDRLATFIVKYRIPLFVALIIIFLVGAWYGKDVQFDFSPRTIFMTKDPELEFLDQFEKTFSPSDNLVYVLLLHPEDVFNRKSLLAIKEMTDEIENLDGIDNVLSLTNANLIKGSQEGFTIVTPLENIPDDNKKLKEIEKEFLSEPLVVKQLVSKDAKATVIIAQFDSEHQEDESRRPIIEKIEKIARAHSDDFKIYFGGLPVISKAYADILRHDLIVFTSLAMLINIIVLILIFKNFHGVIIPLGVVLISTTLTMALAVLTGQKLNALNNIIPPFLLVYGLADSIHQINRYYEEVPKFPVKIDAIRSMLAAMALACLMTSVTTAVGFAANYTAKISIVKKFGLLAAGGVMIAYVVTIIFVPSMLSFFKKPEVWIKKELDKGLLGKFLVWISRVNERHTRLVLLLAIFTVFLAILGITKMRIEHRMLQELKRNHPVSVANRMMEQHLSGVIPLEIAVYSDEPDRMKDPDLLKKLDRLEEFIEKQDGVSNVISFMDLLKRMNQAFHNDDPKYYKIPDSRNLIAQYLLLYSMSGGQDLTGKLLTEDYSKMRISIRTKDYGSKWFFSLLNRIKKFQKKLNIPKDVKIHYTGSSLIVNKALEHVVKDLMSSFIVAFFLVFLLVFIEFGSIRLAALSMIPTTLPMIFTMGFMGFVGIPLRMSTVVIFSISMGIAIDNVIHYVARYKEELHSGLGYHSAMYKTIISSGRAIVSTTFLVIAGFLILVTSNFVATIDLGLLGSITLFIGLISALFFLPVLILTLRPKL